MLASRCFRCAAAFGRTGATRQAGDLFGKTATPVSESIAGGHSTASDSSFLVFAAWINGKNRAKATIENGWVGEQDVSDSTMNNDGDE